MRENASVGVFSLIMGIGTLALLPQVVRGGSLAAFWDPYSPAFFPIFLAILLIVCGAALLYAALSRTAPPVDGEGRIESPMRVAATAGFIVLYTILIYWIGMLVASVVCIAGLAYILGFRRHLIIAMAAIVMPVVIYVLFERLLYVLLPQSQFF